MLKRKEGRACTVQEIATLVGGRVIGDASRVISSLCSLEAPQPQALAFCRQRKSKRPLNIPLSQEIGAVLLAEGERPAGENHPPLIVVQDPVRAFAEASQLFYEPATWCVGIHPLASVDPTAEVGAGTSIAPFACIGPRVKLGSGCVIFPHVVLYPDVEIGEHSVLHAGAVVREQCKLGANTLILSGAVIGSEGFGYYADEQRQLQMVPQVGRVELEADVHVGANSCIDRATLGSTRVGRGTKIDNLTQIGHNVQIGKQTLLCAQVGLAGSSRIGSGVVLGGGVGVADHVSVTDRVRCGALAGVAGDLSSPGDYAGHPAVPAGQWRRQAVAIQQLPEILKERRKCKHS